MKKWFINRMINIFIKPIKRKLEWMSFKKQLNSLQKSVIKYGKYIEIIEKDIAILKKNSHPKREFVRCKDCDCKIKEK